jgi:hypothetical protein
MAAVVEVTVVDIVVFITGSAAFTRVRGAVLQPENTNNAAKISSGANLTNLVFNMYLLIF